MYPLVFSEKESADSFSLKTPPQAARKYATFVAFIITLGAKKNSRACDKVQVYAIVSVFSPVKRIS